MPQLTASEKPQNNGNVLRIENGTRIEIPKKGAITLLYGGHYVGIETHIPAEFEKHAMDGDALALEISEDYTDDLTFRGIVGHKQTSAQTKKLFNHFEYNKKPAYFIDVDVNALWEELIRDSGLGIAEMLLSLKLTDAALSSKIKGSRRKFLQFASLAGLAWTSTMWLEGGGLTVLSPSTVPAFPYLSKLIKMSSALHPERESVVISLRNLVMAYKLIKILELHAGKKPPEITVLLGAVHVGIEDILEDFMNGEINLASMEAELRLLKDTIKFHEPKTYDKIGKYQVDAQGIPRRYIINLPNLRNST